MRTVVFDIGGVLVGSPGVEFGRVDAEYGLPDGTVMSLFRGGSRFVECETGKISFAEFCAHAVAELEAGHGVAIPADRLAATMTAIVGRSLDPAMYELALELDEAGLQIGLCSNIHAEMDEWIRSMFPPGTIDVYCLSYDLGLRKPMPEIWAALAERCAHPVGNIVFVDDWEENVVGAREAGLHAIHFHGADDLRRQLRELGVPVQSAANCR